MKQFLPSLLLALVPFAILPVTAADTGDVEWLVRFDGQSLPGAPWVAAGSPAATLEGGALRLQDDGGGGGLYRAPWKARGEEEIIVEASVKVLGTAGPARGKPAASTWPWRDGAPVMLLVGDGRRQEGLVLFPNQAASFTDRFIPMDTTDRFHTYRLVIRGSDMQIFVDGARRVVGQGAFWKPAASPEPFIQFGSNAKAAAGSALWASVRLGRRPVSSPPAKPQLRVTISQPWEIPERKGVPQTRPYLHDMGGGLLLLSVAQGPDAFYEPYGLLKSTDAGRTWSPVAGLDQSPNTPLPVLRRPDGSILALSRWTWLRPDGSLGGKTFRLNPDAGAFTLEDNRILLPGAYTNETDKDQTICERHIWNDADGGATMVLWTRKNIRHTDGRTRTARWSHLVRSTDGGRTWNHESVIGPGGEPAVARLGGAELTAVIRGEREARMRQVFSHDGGRSWTPPVELEEGRVLPDLVPMSHGVLACSYGRPASCLMFSLDGGKSWSSHHVISDQVRFNYTSIREISPGRLLYIHDAPRLTCLYVDVERLP